MVLFEESNVLSLNTMIHTVHFPLTTFMLLGQCSDKLVTKGNMLMQKHFTLVNEENKPITLHFLIVKHGEGVTVTLCGRLRPEQLLLNGNNALNWLKMCFIS